MISIYLLFITVFLSVVSAVPLAPRDVADPPITSPTASTVWHVGQTETVTWSTANLPASISNPNGMLVLGYWYNNSENLMLDSPLATNLNYSVGQAQIKVPDVPSRSDYIVVLFGDSGNASPEFTIIHDAASSTPPTSSPSATTSSPAQPTSPGSSSSASSSPGSVSTPSTPPSASPSLPQNIGDSSSYPTASSATSPGATPTAPTTTSSTASRSSTVVTVTSSSLPSSAQSSAAWKKYTPGLASSLGTSLTLIFLFTFS